MSAAIAFSYFENTNAIPIAKNKGRLEIITFPSFERIIRISYITVVFVTVSVFPTKYTFPKIFCRPYTFILIAFVNNVPNPKKIPERGNSAIGKIDAFPIGFSLLKAFSFIFPPNSLFF